MTIWYIGGFTPFTQRKVNFIESFNEISVLFCIYIVMLFMMSSDLKFLSKMTILFICVVVTNVGTFIVLAISGVTLDQIDQKKKRDKKESIDKTV